VFPGVAGTELRGHTALSGHEGPGAWPRPPAPREGEVVVALPPLLAAKAALWAAMAEAKIGNSELARRLGLTEGAVRRLLNFRHRSHIGQLETALAALGKRLVVEVQDAA
jgi:antitoxin HicB